MLTVSATVAQISDDPPLRFLETTMYVKETKFQRVTVPSPGFLKFTTSLIRVFWFSKATLSITRV